MTDKHPYTPAQGHLVQVISHFRKAFPVAVTADTLRKLGFASKNESYILNILRFLGLIDQEGNRTETALRIFTLHDDADFSTELGKQVVESYSDLFELYPDDAWNRDRDTLIGFFRASDETTAGVGKLQASTFLSLAAFSGYGAVPEPKASVTKTSPAAAKKKARKPKKSSPAASEALPENSAEIDMKSRDFGLTVRIEINLPADGAQETYDRIFRSIRENLLNE